MEEIILVNKMEEAVKQMIDQILADKNLVGCKCQRCRLDITALSLNSLPPKYVVTYIGDAVTNVDLNSSQWKANVTMAVCNAVETVKSRPRHS